MAEREIVEGWSHLEDSGVIAGTGGELFEFDQDFDEVSLSLETECGGRAATTIPLEVLAECLRLSGYRVEKEGT